MPLKYNSITKEFFIMKKVNTNKVQAVAEQQTNKKVTKSFKPKTVEVEVTNIQLYDEVAVSIESGILIDMESWAYHTEDDLALILCQAKSEYAEGKTTNLIPFTEDKLRDMIIRAGLILNLFDEDNDTHKLCRGIIRDCVYCIDILHGAYSCLDCKNDKKPGRISTVKTMSEGLKYTETDDWDDF
jgi:hypothetical protein